MNAEERIIAYVREHPGCTLADVTKARLGGMPAATADRIFRAAVASRRIVRRPSGGWEVASR